MVCGIGVLLLLIIVGLLLGIYYLKRNRINVNKKHQVESKQSNIKKSGSTFRNNQKSNLYRTDIIKNYFNQHPPTTITDVTIRYNDENDVQTSSPSFASASSATMHNANANYAESNVQNEELNFNNQILA
jgi:hypothetical protein